MLPLRIPLQKVFIQIKGVTKIILAAPADANRTLLGAFPMEALLLPVHLTQKDFKWSEVDFLTDRYVPGLVLQLTCCWQGTPYG